MNTSVHIKSFSYDYHRSVEENSMNRAKVTVHMYVSIDGKIDGKYMEEHG